MSDENLIHRVNKMYELLRELPKEGLIEAAQVREIMGVAAEVLTASHQLGQQSTEQIGRLLELCAKLTTENAELNQKNRELVEVITTKARQVAPATA